jgi:hypothetical protein
VAKGNCHTHACPKSVIGRGAIAMREWPFADQIGCFLSHDRLTRASHCGFAMIGRRGSPLKRRLLAWHSECT